MDGGARNLFCLDQSLSFSPSVAHKGSVACWSMTYILVEEPPTQTTHSPCYNINREAILRSKWMQYKQVVPVCDVMSPVSLQWWHFLGYDRYFESNSKSSFTLRRSFGVLTFRTPSDDTWVQAHVLFIASSGWMIMNNELGRKHPCAF
jgi:hypothetical protein